MLKNFSYLIFIFIFYANKIFYSIFQRNFTGWLSFFLEKKAYRKIKFDDKTMINFFIPNNLVDWRVRTLFSKEPDTIKWINSFEKSDKIIFWDIGANIGLYSIYSAIKHRDKINVIAFEPSTSNLRILSRNISINNLTDIITINQIALTDQKKSFLNMNEPEFIEGSSLNNFGNNTDFEGKEFYPKQKYKILGTSIDHLIQEKIHEVPNYIKIDVDGIEHLILRGGENFFKSNIIKSVLIEINENFFEQSKSVMMFMREHGFKFQKKENFPDKLSFKFKNTYNYIFNKNND